MLESFAERRKTPFGFWTSNPPPRLLDNSTEKSRVKQNLQQYRLTSEPSIYIVVQNPGWGWSWINPEVLGGIWLSSIYLFFHDNLTVVYLIQSLKPFSFYMVTIIQKELVKEKVNHKGLFLFTITVRLLSCCICNWKSSDISG